MLTRSGTTAHPPMPPLENQRKPRGKHERNTSETRSKHEANARASRMHIPSKWLAHGLQVALGWLSLACAMPSRAWAGHSAPVTAYPARRKSSAQSTSICAAAARPALTDRKLHDAPCITPGIRTSSMPKSPNTARHPSRLVIVTG
jgi:hypothetical protein